MTSPDGDTDARDPTWPRGKEEPRPAHRLALEMLGRSLADLRGRRRLVGLLGAAALAVPLGLLTISISLEVPVTDLTRDPTQVTGIHPMIGFLSKVGLVGWVSAVVVCLFVAWSLPREEVNRRDRNFFLWSAVFSAVLLLDDAFLLHEGYWPIPLHEGVYYVAYAGVALLYVRNLMLRPVLGSSAFLLLAMAGFGLSLGLDSSMAIDQMQHFEELVTFLEDLFKFVGIVFWLAYLADAGRGRIRAVMGR